MGAGNAATFADEGHYDWTASFIDGYERVFEISTGTGEGTKVLLNKRYTVLIIDENPSCLKVAYKKSHVRVFVIYAAPHAV